MATHENPTLGTTPVVLLTGAEFVGRTAVVQNHSTTGNVYIGGPGVSPTSFGVKLVPGSSAGKPGADFSVDAVRGEEFWMVSDAAGTEVSILKTEVAN